ncbi:hypothetical protein CDAR_414761 [Caerostris darwini]|uniref:Uncharacterized protein n=1 Tax=Caerostris darwini TaxID=1538125 RepID=A0AAV4RFL9_9ARAC|nr:hypothetical protein CDAR_414761 [Caerostris darwini]
MTIFPFSEVCAKCLCADPPFHTIKRMVTKELRNLINTYTGIDNITELADAFHKNDNPPFSVKFLQNVFVVDPPFYNNKEDGHQRVAQANGFQSLEIPLRLMKGLGGVRKTK